MNQHDSETVLSDGISRFWPDSTTYFLITGCNVTAACVLCGRGSQWGGMAMPAVSEHDGSWICTKCLVAALDPLIDKKKGERA